MQQNFQNWPRGCWAQVNMSDSSVFDEPGGPGSGQEASDTIWSSLESMPPWAGPPAEQYAPGPGSQRPGEARSGVAGLQ